MTGEREILNTHGKVHKDFLSLRIIISIEDTIFRKHLSKIKIKLDAQLQ